MNQPTSLAYDVQIGDRRVRYGTENVWTGTTQALANELAGDTRASHSWETGPITVRVWPHRNDDEHYQQPAPDAAECFNYPGRTP